MERLYRPGFFRPGDLIFQMVQGEAGHVIMVAPDTTRFIHSVSPDGVCYCPVLPIEVVVYRYEGPEHRDGRIGDRAALIAKDWVGNVKYADPGPGLPLRAALAGFGSSKFGRGAHERLMKYQSREETMFGFKVPGSGRPKNAICSELCILAYQLSTTERAPDFIKLDAKYATPVALLDYVSGHGLWEPVDH